MWQVQHLDYGPPPTSVRKRRIVAFWLGFASGVALSVLVLMILAAGGPMLPTNVVYPHFLLVGELLGPARLSPPLGAAAVMATYFIIGPLLYGLYAVVVAERRVLTMSIAAGSHVLLILLVAYLRDVFRFL